MCFHYSLTKKALEIENRFGAKFNYNFESQYHVHGFNHQGMPVITNENKGLIQSFNWGLVPSWVKDIDQAKEMRIKTLNARSETAFELPSFKSSIRSKRCLVPADGFYEWMHLNKLTYPHYIGIKNNDLFAFAGIWESWTEKLTGIQRNTFSILTCEANPMMAKIHNTKKRMPVILKKDYEMDWLNTNLIIGDVKALMAPYEDREMSAYTISRLITARGENSNVPAVLEKLEYPEMGMFSI